MGKQEGEGRVRGGWGLHPHVGKPSPSLRAGGHRAALVGRQKLSNLPHPPPQASSAFSWSSVSVDPSGEIGPLHKNSPHLSSLLRDFGFLMDDHLGHWHVWVLLLRLLDGLYQDLRKTEMTPVRHKAAWLVKKERVMGHYVSGKFNLPICRTRAECRLSHTDDGWTHQPSCCLGRVMD